MKYVNNMEKKKICWLTGSSFIDVDEPIVPELSKYYDIRWVVIRQKDSWYSEKDINLIFQKSNCECKVLSFPGRMSSLSSVKVYKEAISYLKCFNPDLYYINYIGIPYLWPMLLLSSIPNKTIIYPCHDFKDHKGVKNRIYFVLLKKMIFNSLTHFQFFSRTQRSMFEKKYRGKDTFYAPLALKHFGNMPVIEKDKDIVQFLFFGSIRENKGLEYLIQATNKISSKYHGQFIVKIAGACCDWDYFLRQIKNVNDFDLDIRRIENKEIPMLFARAHFLVLPYIDVTQSGPLLISYNYHLPVIASDHDGFKEYIEDKHNGYLFKNQNADSLADVLSYIIEHKDAYKTVCSNLNTFINDNCSLKSIVEKYQQGFDAFIKY